jgi:maltose-binding protein MalE
MNRALPLLLALFLSPVHLFAWTNGELLIWMDNQRGRALEPIANKFESELGIKVTIETPHKSPTVSRLPPRLGKGRIW